MRLSAPVPYTRLVSLGKRALWLLAIVLTLGLIVLAWVNRADETSRIVFSGEEGAKAKPAAPEPAAMLRPRYQGIDAKNRPFNVTAERAVQEDANAVRLERVDADMTLADTSWLVLTARGGLYKVQEKTLDLSGDIHLFYEGGYEFRTEHAFLNINTGQATGEQPVEGQGPAGTLKADRFTIEDRGAILRFNGNVQVVLYL